MIGLEIPVDAIFNETAMLDWYAHKIPFRTIGQSQRYRSLAYFRNWGGGLYSMECLERRLFVDKKKPGAHRDLGRS